MIDLRSDTVTKPASSMLKSILATRLGDDVLREDLTVNQLEEFSADLFSKEAAIFLPSGTMANLVAILVHCERGTEAILGDQSHTFYYEGGGISAYGGVHSRQLKNQDNGTIKLEDIEHAIRLDDIHFPKTRLICLENTHNRCYGTPLSPQYINSVSNIASKNKLKMHIDGARIFNASVYLNTSVKLLCKKADSVSFCLSKGLSAPVGSLLCGDKHFIGNARRIRKSLGGGMRQAGVLAAPGLYALKNMIDRLSVDHENAKTLAKELSEIDSISIDLQKVKTNIIYFRFESNSISIQDFHSLASEKGLLFYQTSPNDFRMVTHTGISKNNVLESIAIIKSILYKN